MSDKTAIDTTQDDDLADEALDEILGSKYASCASKCCVG